MSWIQQIVMLRWHDSGPDAKRRRSAQVKPPIAQLSWAKIGHGDPKFILR